MVFGLNKIVDGLYYTIVTHLCQSYLRANVDIIVITQKHLLITIAIRHSIQFCCYSL